MVVNQDPGPNHRKWRLPEGGPDWEGFLSVPENYAKELPAYIIDFLEVVYTIGNFLPLPAGCNVYTALRDYWDLKLYHIYHWYQDHQDRHLAAIVKCPKDKRITQHRVEAFRAFLESFGNWDSFVERMDQQPFVTVEGDHFGPPLELWEGHFEAACRLPRTEPEFRQFFVNARARILERGMRIAKKLAKT